MEASSPCTDTQHIYQINNTFIHNISDQSQHKSLERFLMHGTNTVFLYLVDGAQGSGVVVQVVGVDSEFGAQLHKHVSDTLLCTPLLQPGL